jgi:hypothetical protein
VTILVLRCRPRMPKMQDIRKDADTDSGSDTAAFLEKYFSRLSLGLGIAVVLRNCSVTAWRLCIGRRGVRHRFRCFEGFLS